MRTAKIASLILACLLALTALMPVAVAEDKPTVRVAFWGQNMLYGVAPALREAFPDVNFEFTIAYNTTEYYKYLYEHDDLPDIITVRRFSLLDAVELKDTLVDLSTTDLAASYYQNYLQNYTFDDGVINWLPAVAEVQSIIANKSLFERCGIELPTDYASFVSACEKFTELGIIPFANEWNADYGCLEVLEGINADLLQSLEGRMWRSAYESGTVAGLDDTIWPQCFERMEQFLKDTGSLGAEYRDASVFKTENFSGIVDGMKKGYIAMIRNGGADVYGYNANENSDDEYVMLPYFGDTEDQNWVLTYPYYQGAINSRSSVDPELLMRIFEFMFGQKCQDELGLGNNMMSYSTDVYMDVNIGMHSLDPYLDSNKIFVRLANNSFFSACYDVVGRMITGELDAAGAYEAFNAEISNTTAEEEPLIMLDTGYEWAFDAQHGSQATSAILNTLRTSWGCDMAIMYPASVSKSVYAGSVYSSKLKYMFCGIAANGTLFSLTGAQLTELTAKMVEGWDAEINEQYGYATDLMYIPYETDGLPVSSGFEMQVSRTETGFKLDGITVNGQPIDTEATYTVAYCVPGQVWYQTLVAAGIDSTTGDKNILVKNTPALTAWFTDGNQLVEPTDYITLR